MDHPVYVINTCSILLTTLHLYPSPYLLYLTTFLHGSAWRLFFGRQIVSLDLFSQRDYETTLFAFPLSYSALLLHCSYTLAVFTIFSIIFIIHISQKNYCRSFKSGYFWIKNPGVRFKPLTSWQADVLTTEPIYRTRARFNRSRI